MLTIKTQMKLFFNNTLSSIYLPDLGIVNSQSETSPSFVALVVHVIFRNFLVQATGIW